jgi:hypothetical protein
MGQKAAIHRWVCGTSVLLGFLARVRHAAPQRPGFGQVEACAGAQRREAHMMAAAIIQSVSGERDEAYVQRHGFATMKQF